MTKYVNHLPSVTIWVVINCLSDLKYLVTQINFLVVPGRPVVWEKLGGARAGIGLKAELHPGQYQVVQVGDAGGVVGVF